MKIIINNILKELFTTKNRSSLFFILINIFVAIVGFVRSFVFIKFFDFEALGILTLVQTGAMLVGFFQIGLINGGYRLVALQKNELTEEVNNLIFSYFSILCLVLIGLYTFLSAFGVFDESISVLLTGVFGISLLSTNWLTNVLIAEKSFKLLNITNFISALLALICLPLAFYWGVNGGIVVLLMQPLVFSLIILSTQKSKRPTSFLLSIPKIKMVLDYGFIPFLSGLFFLLYLQIEKWSISFYLGSESLGQLYLLFLIVSLWVLVPTSVMNVFFPKAVLSYDKKDFQGLIKVVNYHFIFVFLYVGLISFGIYLFFEPLVGFFFSEHLPFTKYVFLALIGLTFRSLSDPISVYLNTVVYLKPIFWSDLTSTVFYILSIFYMVYMDNFTLTGVVMILNLRYIVNFIFFIVAYLIDKQRRKKIIFTKKY